MSDWSEMRQELESKEKKGKGIDTLHGKRHYTIMAGSIITEDTFDDDGNITGTQSYTVMQNLTVYVEDNTIDVRPGIFVRSNNL